MFLLLQCSSDITFHPCFQHKRLKILRVSNGQITCNFEECFVKTSNEKLSDCDQKTKEATLKAFCHSWEKNWFFSNLTKFKIKEGKKLSDDLNQHDYHAMSPKEPIKNMGATNVALDFPDLIFALFKSKTIGAYQIQPRSVPRGLGIKEISDQRSISTASSPKNWIGTTKK